jgi:hypothetical protein
MPQQAGTSPNPRLAQLDNGAKRPLVIANYSKTTTKDKKDNDERNRSDKKN